MGKVRKCTGGLILAVVVLFSSPGVKAQELGSISFLNSGSGAAQLKFIEGVKDLHSFEFDEAAEAFHEVQRLDPNFALAYWGEAMSYNHPLWAQLDLPAARKALERLAPTPEGRLAKAHTEKEKAYLEAVNRLFLHSRNEMLIPGMLVMPLISWIIFLVAGWAAMLVGFAGNLIVLPLAILAGVVSFKAVICLLRTMSKRKW